MEQALVYKVKVTLLNQKTEVSRTFYLSEKSTFETLGCLIMTYFEWDSSLPWKFVTYIHPHLKPKQDFVEIFQRQDSDHVFGHVSNFLAYTLEAKEVRLNQILNLGRDEIDFIYDYETKWFHNVKIEEFLEIDSTKVYPILLHSEGIIPTKI